MEWLVLLLHAIATMFFFFLKLPVGGKLNCKFD